MTSVVLLNIISVNYAGKDKFKLQRATLSYTRIRVYSWIREFNKHC